MSAVDEDLTEVFRQEAHAIVSALPDALLRIERQEGAADARNEALRQIHTLKGMANMEGHPDLARLCHEAETVLLRDADPPVEGLLRRVDGIRRWLDENGLGVRRDDAREGAAYVTVQTERLDRLLNLAGELTVITTRLLYEDATGESSAATLRTLSAFVRSLQEEVMKTRLLPARTLFAGLPRLVRDAAKAKGVEVDLALGESDVSLDRGLVDRLGGALAHVLQNAVAHGIETPEERVRAGKPPRGQIRIQLRREQETVAIEVADDGRGLDHEAIRVKAIERGVWTLAEAAEAGPEQLAEVVFAPGFSTREAADSHAGRGIGLTAVRETVREVGGTIRLASRPGKGTTLTLRLPPTVALLETLVARADGATIALPLRNVRRIHAIGDAAEVAGRLVLLAEARAIPLLTVQGRPATLEEGRFIVLLEAAHGASALVVEELLGTHSTILKPLDSSILETHANAIGAAVLGSGTLAIVVDPDHYEGSA